MMIEDNVTSHDKASSGPQEEASEMMATHKTIEGYGFNANADASDDASPVPLSG